MSTYLDQLSENAKKRSANFSENEKKVLAELVARYPIVEEKRKSAMMEDQKKKAWKLIWEGFSAREDTMRRSEEQLKISWKNIKSSTKSEMAKERRERFRTGGGPEETGILSSTSELVASVLDKQKPINGIEDDDHLDSDVSTPTIIVTSMPRIKKRRASLAHEYHEKKMAYLKVEHDLKIEILQMELRAKQEEREERIREHEASIRNLDKLYASYL